MLDRDDDLISRRAAIAKVEKAREAARTLTEMDFVLMLKDQPAVDAIPMWWITEKFLDVMNKDKELSNAVWLVRKAWQKEQEVYGT